MKKLILKIVAAVVVLLIVAVVVLPMVIPADKLKKELARQIEQRTGFVLNLAGDVHAKGFPNFGMELNGVTLTTPKEGGSKQLLSAEKLSVGLNLAAVMKGELSITSLILEKPQILVEYDQVGRLNWQPYPLNGPKPSAENNQPMLTLIGRAEAAEPEAAPPVPAAKGTIVSKDTLELLRKLKVKKLEINGGQFTLSDLRAKTSQVLSGIDADLSMPDISEPMTFKVSLDYGKLPVEAKGTITTLLSLLDGNKAQAEVEAKAADAKAALKGEMTLGGVKGPLVLDVPSVGGLLEKLGANAAGVPVKTVHVEGPFACVDVRCSLTDGVIALDQNKLNGTVSASFSEAVPVIAANLKSDVLDLRPFIHQSEAKPMSLSLIASAQAAEAAGALPVDALKAVNGSFDLHVQKLELPMGEAGNVALKAQGRDGAWTIRDLSGAMFGGSLATNGTVRAAGSEMAIDTKVKAEKVDVTQALAAFAPGVTAVSGLFTGDIDVNGHGVTSDQLLRTLDGNANVNLTQGKIQGVDIAAILTNATTNIGALATNIKQGGSTDIKSLAGTFNIAGGVFNTNDLKADLGAASVAAAGAIDLPGNAINMRLTPSALPGKGGAQGLTVPIIVSGALDHPNFTPDTKAVLKDALSDPSKVKATIDQGGEQVKNIKKQLKEGKKPGDLLKQFLPQKKDAK